MPLKVNEFVIQAKFDSEASDQSGSQKDAEACDAEAMKDDIIKECMERVEEYLKKKEMR